MATEVQGYRGDDEQRFEVWIDGIVAFAVPYIVADKFKGLAPALMKATVSWAQEHDADEAKLNALAKP